MKRLKMPVIFSAFFFLFSCGIEEYYYLPQVPESNITRLSNTEAKIIIPSIGTLPGDVFYYATGYTIFYRIYISGSYTTGEITTTSQMDQINTSLTNDYNTFYPYTTTNNTLVISENTFRNRGYYALEFSSNYTIPKSGGILEFEFPAAGVPIAKIANINYNLLRTSSAPQPDRNFFYSTELNQIANSSNNPDVARNTSEGYAYVSMYIVAVGTNQDNFTPIYSKPTHINIFRLP